MGCANGKPSDVKKPADGLQFNAADLDDVDQSTHRKKKNVVVPPAPVVVLAENPVADAESVAVAPVESDAVAVGTEPVTDKSTPATETPVEAPVVTQVAAQ